LPCVNSGGRLGVSRQSLPRPPAVETDEVGAMHVQDVRGERPSLTLLGQHHDHEATCIDIFDMTHQVRVFLSRARCSNQATLKPCEESMFNAFGVEPLRTCFTVQNVDVVLVEAGL